MSECALAALVYETSEILVYRVPLIKQDHLQDHKLFDASTVNNLRINLNTKDVIPQRDSFLGEIHISKSLIHCSIMARDYGH